MKENQICDCIFCGAPASDSNPKELLEVHRYCKAPQKIVREEKISVILPTCNTCYKKLHPHHDNISQSKLPIYLGVIAVICVCFSCIQRDLFSVLPALGIIVFLLICAGGAFAITWFGFIMTYALFDDASKGSVNVMPYSELEAVTYIKNNGFIDTEDDNCTIINTDDVGYVPRKTVQDILKNRYGLKL